MAVVLSYKDAVIFSSNSSSSSDSIISIDTSDNVKANLAGLSGPEWDPSFHGSVHTATMAVCTVLVIFVVVLGTFGNGLVLISALQCRRLRSNFDVLVYNLAGTDFIVCSCLAPTFLYLLFASPPPAPREFCGGFLFACTLCGLASLLTLMIIAGHRQSRVTGKVKGALTARRTAAILVTIYAISFGAAFGGMLRVTLSWSDSQTSCQALLNSSRIPHDNVIMVFVTPVVAVCCVVILTAYCVIARAVRTQTYLRVKALQPLLQNSAYSKLSSASEYAAAGKAKDSPPCPELKQILVETGEPADIEKERTQTQTSSPAKPERRERKEILKHCACCNCMAALDKENKAITMCLVVILIIALCWTPLVISQTLELFTGESIILFQVKLCGIALIFLNSALDPYLYAQNCGRSTHRFGSFLWDVFRCECRLPRPNRKKIKHTGGSKPSAFPGNRNVRSQTGIPSSALVLRPDCATLQFLNPIDPLFRDNPKIVKSSTRRSRRSKSCIFHSSKSRIIRTNAKPERGYTNNLLQFGQISSVYGAGYKRADVHRRGRAHAQAGMMSDVRTLVHKSCCHGKLPEDLSLIDS
ncbi:G protein-coupled receptor 75 [Plakobranchus ocellatus]|uniref:G protein-coupled receptor 75 n=1 Tax=Plakobranchus ocellatus TaxID=259542 RepID=A0AAV4ATE1_9GAST|nr:G protein-coupled receptor 75 [Plakobranchus ocellatus]